jgi:hypothetical protein
MWPPSGRCVNKGLILRDFSEVCEPMHRCEIKSLKKIHELKYTLKFGILVKSCG